MLPCAGGRTLHQMICVSIAKLRFGSGGVALVRVRAAQLSAPSTLHMVLGHFWLHFQAYEKELVSLGAPWCLQKAFSRKRARTPLTVPAQEVLS